MRSILFCVLFCSSILLAYAQTGAGYALDFDGVNDYVEISDDASLNPRNAMTIEAWIYPTAFATNVWENSILCKHNWAAGNKGYVLRCGANGKLSFIISARSSGSWVEAVSSSAVLELNKWFHVAGVFDGDSVKIYVNGVMEAFTLYRGMIDVSSGANARIGQISTGTGRNFNGMIDEVRLWDTAFDQSILRKWMCQKLDTSHAFSSHLAGHWRMDEGSGSSLSDYSSNSNDGKISGPDWRGSGASIGDKSIYTYVGKDLTLNAPQGDYLHTQNYRGSPAYVHLIYSEGKSMSALAPNINAQLDTTHYYGLYIDQRSSVSADVALNYSKNRSYDSSNACGLDLFRRYPGDSMYWTDANSILSIKGDSLYTKRHNVSEFAIVQYAVDSNSIIGTITGKPWFCTGDSVELIASGNQNAKYKWFYNKVELKGDTFNTIYASKTGDYKVEVSRKNTTCVVKSAAFKLTDRTPPKVSLQSLSPVCESVDTVILKGGSPSGGVFYGPSIQGNYFFPSGLGKGNYEIVYQFTDTALCTSRDTQTQVVWQLPVLNPLSGIWTCDNVDSFPLKHVTPLGGTYSGKGISKNYFIPSLVSNLTGLYAYSYAYTDSNKCSNVLDDSLELRKSSTTILNPIPNSCLGTGAITLKGLPSGGIYTGNGVNGNTFDPDNAGIGEHSITYRYTNSVGCPSENSKTVKVFKGTNVGWTFDKSVCVNGDSMLLSGATPKGGTYLGKGVKGNYFHPTIAGPGKHMISYQFIDSNKCSNTANGNYQVFDTSKLVYMPQSGVCPDVDGFQLMNVSPTGGTYTGNAVARDSFFPRLAQIGMNKVFYEYLDANSCKSEFQFQIKLFNPQSISVQLAESSCEGSDPLRITVNPLGGKLSGKGVIGSFFSPSSAGLGVHEIVYSLVDSLGCTLRDTAKTTVAPVPKVSLDPFAGMCADAETFTLTGGLPDGGTYKVNEEIKEVFDPSDWNTGKQTVQYVYENEWGCSDSTSTFFFVNALPSKPSIILSDSSLRSTSDKGNQWFGEKGMINGETSQEFKPRENGKYWVEVVSDSGCVAVSDAFAYDLIGISFQAFIDGRIYPNPSSGIFYLESDMAYENYEVSDLSGKTILKGRVHIIDLTSYPAGVYILNLQINTHRHYARIVKW
jgi:hypothetical protein